MDPTPHDRDPYAAAGSPPFPSGTGRRRLRDVLDGGPRTAEQIPGSVLGPYRVEAELGRGAVGAVFRAVHAVTGQRVALKVLLDGTAASEKQHRRFLREAELGASLNHPGVARVFEYGAHDGLAFLALEFVDGGTLQDRLDSLSPKQFATLMVDVCEGVGAAHAVGIVHRDLKPANILLRSDGSPVVSDFGLARDSSLASSLTRTGAAVGSPSYMSPEQVRGLDPIPQCDVFGLGVVLYRGTTGRLPFPSTAITQLWGQITSLDPSPPHAVNPGVPEEISQVCMRALAKDPRERPATAAGLAQALRQALGDAGRPRRRVPWRGIAVALGLLGATATAFGLTRPPDVSHRTRFAAPPLAPAGPQLAKPPTPPADLPPEAPGAAGVVAPVGAGWVAAWELNQAQFEERVRVFAARNLHIQRVEVNATRQPPTFTAVWRSGGPKTAVHIEVDPAGWSRAWDAERGRHYRPISRSVSGPPKARRQTGVWVEDRARWISYGLQPQAVLEERHVRHQKAGFRLVSLAAARGKDRSFASTWVRDEAQGELALDVSPDDLGLLLRQRGAQGYRPIQIVPYGPRLARRYGVVWVRDGRSGLALLDQSREAFRRTGHLLAERGYEPVGLVAVGEGPTLRITSLWARSAGAPRWHVSGAAVPGTEAIEAALRAHMERADVSCAALAVTLGRRLVFARGYTRAPQEQAFRTLPTTPFRLGALSQPLTALAVLSLVEEERLGLDQPLDAVFAGLEGAELWDPRLARVTVRQLLGHRGGWDRQRAPRRFDPERGFEVFDPTRDHDAAIARLAGVDVVRGPEDVFKAICRQPLDVAPGARFAPSDVGVLVLGLAVQAASRQPYEEAVHATVSRAGPTGLRLGSGAIADALAAGEALCESLNPSTYRLNLRAMAAHNGWVGSAVDVARVLSALSDMDRSPLLRGATLREAWTPAPGGSFGLGWHVEEPGPDPRVSHDAGDLPGTWGHMERAPGGLGLVLLMNRDAPAPELVEVLRSELARIEWPASDQFPKR